MFSLSQQNQKELILLIDEPELHVHPKLQEEFVEILLKISETAQIILTSHSPILLRQIFCHTKSNIKILKRIQNTGRNNDIGHMDIKDKRVLGNISANEINYLAYDMVTEEFHNELYGALQEKIDKFSIQAFNNYLNKKYKIECDRKWKNNNQTHKYSLLSYIRTAIHHPEKYKE